MAKKIEMMAFPCDVKLPNGLVMRSSGMSLRDWFAGQIAAAAVVNATGIRPGTETAREAWTVVAQASYELADAMLTARAKAEETTR